MRFKHPSRWRHVPVVSWPQSGDLAFPYHWPSLTRSRLPYVEGRSLLLALRKSTFSPLTPKSDKQVFQLLKPRRFSLFCFCLSGFGVEGPKHTFAIVATWNYLSHLQLGQNSKKAASRLDAVTSFFMDRAGCLPDKLRTTVVTAQRWQQDY
jgi:hypothetical protein